MSYRWGYSPLGKQGGIHAVSRSGGFGQSWLAREWFDLLALTTERSVMQGGANMARRNAVQTITVTAGHISARVLEYSTLYAVEIELPVLAATYQEILLDELAAEPVVAAQILGGVVPRDLFTLDGEMQLGLFPASLRDFDIACGCYRWEVPCKHATAVHLLVAEEFDRDPLLFFVLRGIARDVLVRRLGGALAEAATIDTPVAPLAADPQTFWRGTPRANATDEFALTTQDVVPLTPFSFWAGTRPFDAVMNDYLAQAAEMATRDLRAAMPFPDAAEDSVPSQPDMLDSDED